MVTSSPTNPYEPPREAAPQHFSATDFSDRDAAELADLHHRVAELERRVSRSWVVHPNLFLRICGVFGYWVLGYAILAGIVSAGLGVIWLITGYWPS